MKYVTAVCRKCGEDVRVEIPAGKTVEQVKEAMGRQTGFSCPGRHVELSGPLNYWTVDWSAVYEGETPRGPKEFGRELIKAHGKENVFYLGDRKRIPRLGIKPLQSVPDLNHLGFGEFGNDAADYIRYDAPDGSIRFYVRVVRVHA
jgi:hypothetical protein